MFETFKKFMKSLFGVKETTKVSPQDPTEKENLGNKDTLHKDYEDLRHKKSKYSANLESSQKYKAELLKNLKGKEMSEEQKGKLAHLEESEEYYKDRFKKAQKHIDANRKSYNAKTNPEAKLEETKAKSKGLLSFFKRKRKSEKGR